MKTSLGANLLKPGEPVLIAVLDGDIQLQTGLQRTAAELGHSNWRVQNYSSPSGSLEKSPQVQTPFSSGNPNPIQPVSKK